MSLLIVGLDVTIVNVALPSIGREFHASVSGLQWTIDAYTLVLASLLMLSGSTADRLGRKRTFVVGLLVFSAGSLLCSLAPSLTLLVVFRMVQAVGGSMLNPVAMSIITNTFTDPQERAQAVGVWAAVVGVQHGTRTRDRRPPGRLGRLAFDLLDQPAGRVGRHRPRPSASSPSRGARRLAGSTSVGQALVIVFLAVPHLRHHRGTRAGVGGRRSSWRLRPGVASLVGLIVWEGRREEPLIDLRFFRSIPFSGAAVIAVAAFATLGGFLFLNTLYLQEVRGLSPLKAGLYTLPMAVMTMLLPPISGRIVGTRGPRIPLLIAGIALTVSCVMLSRSGATTSFAWLFAAYVVFGIGFGFVNAPITNAAVSGMPRAQAGVASAIASTSRQVGATLGVAVVGALVTSSLGVTSPGRLGLRHPCRLVGPGRVRRGGARARSGGDDRLGPGRPMRTARELNPEFLEGTSDGDGRTWTGDDRSGADPDTTRPAGLVRDVRPRARQRAAPRGQRRPRSELRPDQGAPSDRPSPMTMGELAANSGSTLPTPRWSSTSWSARASSNAAPPDGPPGQAGGGDDSGVPASPERPRRS